MINKDRSFFEYNSEDLLYINSLLQISYAPHPEK